MSYDPILLAIVVIGIPLLYLGGFISLFFGLKWAYRKLKEYVK